MKLLMQYSPLISEENLLTASSMLVTEKRKKRHLQMLLA